MINKGRTYISSAFAEGKVDRKLRMLEAVARILSDNYNVTVSFSPDGECKTAPESMILPYDKGVDEALILGLCGHETGHLKHTDFKIGRSIARHKKVSNRALLYIITNALEDVRVEIAMEQEYPGFKDMFERTVPYMREKVRPMLEREEKIKQLQAAGKTAKEIVKVVTKDCQEEVARLAARLREAGFSEDYVEFEVNQLKSMQTTPMAEISKILDVLYLQLRGYPCDWYAPETIHYVADFLLEPAKKVSECKSTEDSLELAIELYKIMEEQQKQQQQQAQEEQKQREKEEKKQKEEQGQSKPDKDGKDDDNSDCCSTCGNPLPKDKNKEQQQKDKKEPKEKSEGNQEKEKKESKEKSKDNQEKDKKEQEQDSKEDEDKDSKSCPDCGNPLPSDGAQGNNKPTGGGKATPNGANTKPSKSGTPQDQRQGKGDNQSSSIKQPYEEDEDGVRTHSDELLTVGCKVKHLNNDHKIGVVVAIDKVTQEVEVEWQEKPSKE